MINSQKTLRASTTCNQHLSKRIWSFPTANPEVLKFDSSKNECVHTKVPLSTRLWEVLSDKDSLFRQMAAQVFYIRWKREFVKCSYALQTKIHVNSSYFCKLILFKTVNHIEKKTYLQKPCIIRNSKKYHSEPKINISCKWFKK